MLHENLANKNGLKIKHSGIPALASFAFDTEKNLHCKTLMTQQMLKRGYLSGTSCYCSTAHTHEIIETYSENLDKVFEQIKDCLDNDSLKAERCSFALFHLHKGCNKII